MTRVEIIKKLWETIHQQQWEQLHEFFEPKAIIEWPNTSEIFTKVENFIRANSEYPGDWNIRLERIEETKNTVITVVYVSLDSSNISFYATSFFEFLEEKIIKITEYWGEIGLAPEWRKKLDISDILNK